MACSNVSVRHNVPPLVETGFIDLGNKTMKFQNSFFVKIRGEQLKELALVLLDK